ncbi:MAG: methyltransferase domain-containing protein [Saprospiraceae bacterium]
MKLYYNNINIKTYLVRRLRKFKLFNYIFPLGTGGSPEYSFSVWIRHLNKLYSDGNGKIPETIAELGPGSTLGVGLAALLSGSSCYFALDVQNYINRDKLIKDFDEMVNIFKERRKINGNFPSHILTDNILEKSLNETRIKTIRDEIILHGENSKYIKYYAPWTDDKLIIYSSIDFILSQCVLEHVDQLEGCYTAMSKWLKPGGYSSHLVDFQCHEFTRHWNGHWAFTETEWDKVRGTNDWAINREPANNHNEYALKSGFEIIEFNRRKPISKGISRNKLSKQFVNISDEDLETSFIDILLRKKEN